MHELKSVYIDRTGDGSILHVCVSKVNNLTQDTYYGDGLTIDTDYIGKEDK